ncbi:MAG: ATPase [Firmicutes bacterium HGW-Firmicutes-7]|nr:MAG: ATPase [Firmicutes bacterium HGW-Firmicutes-7]
MRDFYKLSKEDVLKSLDVDVKGLNDEQVVLMREQYGINELEETKTASALMVFILQFKDFLVWILIVAAILSALLGKLESTIVIVAVIILNAILGTVQHVKAEQSLKSLKSLSSPTAKVLRNGEKIEIPSEEVVVGELLYLEAGDFVAGDGRIIEGYSLKVNESALTGESESAEKHGDEIDLPNLSPGDQKNMVFSGSHVTYGRGVIIITAVGIQTEIGKIARLLEQAKEKQTPLQQSLDDFGKKLAVIILIISAIIFGLNIYRGSEVLNSLMFAISLAVAAIPEALSSIVTIVLAIGTRKMAAENAIIRKLHAVESLGSISVICSDKTGTLTQNKMTVKQIYVRDRLVKASELDLENSLDFRLLMMSMLCNDSTTTENQELGDPTEIALVTLGELYGWDELKTREKYIRFQELPFDSDRKLMSTLNQMDDGSEMITKGALDVILKRSTHIEGESGVREFTNEDQQRLEEMNIHLSNKGLRVLAFAWKKHDNPKLDLSDEYDLVFMGLIAMMDPPREESEAAVKSCHQAGIRTVMITGDHKITASAIAREIGILKDATEAIEGAELEAISDEALKELVPKISVYARVSPEHKIRIVNAWQALGHVVAMTGDGVNDAPALKQADVGIAMGITGTEVAKDASSMVLTDDNFSTIVKAIGNGRSIYGNIKNAVKFLLSGNTAGILSVLYASLAALPVPYAPVHLLFINLLTDSLPAIAIGMEAPRGNVLLEKPRDIGQPILDKAFGIEILLEGLIIAVVSMIAFHIGLNYSEAVAMTMAFATLCLSRLVHGFNCRMKEPLTIKSLFSNRYSWMAFGLGAFLLTIVLTWSPMMSVFEISILTTSQLITIISLSIVPLFVVQASKWIIKLFGERKFTN